MKKVKQTKLSGWATRAKQFDSLIGWQLHWNNNKIGFPFDSILAWPSRTKRDI